MGVVIFGQTYLLIYVCCKIFACFRHCTRVHQFISTFYLLIALLGLLDMCSFTPKHTAQHDATMTKTFFDVIFMTLCQVNMASL